MADNINYEKFQKVEKWTTKEKFNALGNLTEIETGTEYNLTGAIDETDLASDLQTKINGKLTAPTTPSAESAVTMLADGTVGTKLLSEIGGGGGGKLYLHNLTCSISDTEKAYLVLYTSGYSNTFDLTSLKTFLTEHSNALKNTIGMYDNTNEGRTFFSYIAVMGSSLTGYKYEMNGSPVIKEIISVTDIVVEL